MMHKYHDYVPNLVSLIDYIVRALFKALFRDQAPNYYNLYVRRVGAESYLTKAVIEALAAASKDSTEQRTAQAILYTTFSKRKVEEIIEDIQDVVKKANRRRREASGAAKEQQNNGGRLNCEGCGPNGSSSKCNTGMGSDTLQAEEVDETVIIDVSGTGTRHIEDGSK